ncbi:sialin isoform X1 [Patella vulgata]|uniref:sialin isoform X1 n=1 Tax=Patella vulgata TaxID=6465 RepID=UPI0021807750|nr:sialin isoform X1 [Patella vulgata]
MSSEKTPLLESKGRNEDAISKVPYYWSERWKLAYILFIGTMAHFSLRTNLSVSIVCMVNQTNSSNSYLHNQSRSRSDEGTLNWDTATQTGLLSAYFYGYLVLQIPGGWVASKFGPKKVVGIGMTLAGIATLLTPLAAGQNVIYVYIIRVIAGLCGGVIYPSIYTLWGRWAPPLEASLLIAVTGIGCGIGTIVTFAMTGVLCDSSFLNGWPSVFYITGGFALLWSILWILAVADGPELSKRISAVEREYILKSLSNRTPQTDTTIPWLSILTCSATWACALCNFCTDWLDYSLLTCLPTFMHDVLKYDIQENGILSCIPVLLETTSSLVACYIADKLRQKKILSTTYTRRLFQVTGYIGAAGFLMGTGYISKEQRTLAVVFLSISTAFNGFSMAGYSSNLLDFAPRYAGVICGICNFIGTVPGMVAPIVVGVLTPHKSQEEWRDVFYLGGGMALLSAVLYVMLARSDIQPWAAKHIEIIIENPQSVIKVPIDDNSVNLSTHDRELTH